MAGITPKTVTLLLNAALEQDESARPAYLDAACEGDPELRSQVGALLAAHAEAATVLETAAYLPSMAAGEFGASSPGDTIGPYRLVREIGRGGMGAAYLATR